MCACCPEAGGLQRSRRPTIALMWPRNRMTYTSMRDVPSVLSVPYLLRHLAAVLALPVTVVVLVPMWISRRYSVRPTWPATGVGVTLLVGGALLLALGLTLFAASLHQFFSRGRGTLAPWDPPRRLVVSGPYRYVRNPMIAGVIFTLFGVAAAMRSVQHAWWAFAFLTINAVYIPLLEEPLIERRFGDDYRRYRTHVPRFIPRWRPWSDDHQDDAARTA